MKKDEAERVLWDICERFNLGAGGCPDGLIRKHIESLEATVRLLEENIDGRDGIISELQSDKALLNDLCSKKHDLIIELKEQLKNRLPMCPICGKEVALICPDDLKKLQDEGLRLEMLEGKMADGWCLVSPEDFERLQQLSNQGDGK